VDVLATGPVQWVVSAAGSSHPDVLSSGRRAINRCSFGVRGRRPAEVPHARGDHAKSDGDQAQRVFDVTCRVPISRRRGRLARAAAKFKVASGASDLALNRCGRQHGSEGGRHHTVAGRRRFVRAANRNRTGAVTTGRSARGPSSGSFPRLPTAVRRGESISSIVTNAAEDAAYSQEGVRWANWMKCKLTQRGYTP
jgi:hypothetical protein